MPETEYESVEREIVELKLKIRDVECRLNVNERQIDVTTTKLDYVIDTLKQLSIKIDELTTKPQRRWDMLITVLITSIVSGLVGILLTIFTRGYFR